ncbi:MAG: helix-turn-helix domain-containing protein [Planctomycetota bacterium]|nr:MAG: helix-turn-helix domain-containing protein [Planctomycetota bacterium]
MSGRRQDIPKPVPEVMTIDDLAGYLQVSKSSLYKLAQEGRVPGQKVGRHWRFRKDAIDRWLERRDAEHRVDAEEHE